MAGGTPLSWNVGSGTILADNVACKAAASFGFAVLVISCDALLGVLRAANSAYDSAGSADGPCMTAPHKKLQAGSVAWCNLVR